MDHRIFQFATRGQSIKGLAHYNLKQNMCLCSKQSSLFSFYALPSGGKSKDAVVHLLQVWLLIWHLFVSAADARPAQVFSGLLHLLRPQLLLVDHHLRHLGIVLHRRMSMLIRLVQTTAILLQPATNALCCSKNGKKQLIATQCISRWSQQNRCSLNEGNYFFIIWCNLC